MAARVSLKLRKEYYNKCNPDESLTPDDPRYVDIDERIREARGKSRIDALANRIELSNKPVCEFFTGLPGSGKSTELNKLAKRLRDEEGAHLLPVLIDAEEVLDLHNPLGEADVLVAILYKTDAILLAEEGRDANDAMQEGRLARLWRWITTTEVEFKSIEVSAAAKVGDGSNELGAEAKMVADLKTSPSLRKTVRDKVAAHMTAFLREVRDLLVDMQGRAQKLGYAGLVIIVDSLEKLRGLSANWQEVLGRAEKLFASGAPYLRLPVHVVYTMPPAVVYRIREDVFFLPMLKIFDREGKPAAGFEAAREIVRQRIPDEHLNEFFGPTSCESRMKRLIEWSGGYPREIVRLLQICVAEPSLDERTFRQVLETAGEQYTQLVPDYALPWLARVFLEKRPIFEGEEHRAIVDLMLQNNVVLRYQNDRSWVDLHPAVREMPALQAEIAKLRSS